MGRGTVCEGGSEYAMLFLPEICFSACFLLSPRSPAQGSPVPRRLFLCSCHDEDDPPLLSLPLLTCTVHDIWWPLLTVIPSKVGMCLTQPGAPSAPGLGPAQGQGHKL